MAMDRQEFLDLARLHAQGLLEGAERSRFEAALAAANASDATDPGLKAAYAEAVDTAAHLSLAAPEAALAPDILGKVMARIGASATGSTASPAPVPTPEKPRIAFILPLPFWVTSSVVAMVLCMGS